jgi:sugar phosphate isomerase/epimerase
MVTLSKKLILSYSSHYGETFENFIRIAYARGFRAVQLTPDQAPNLYSEFPSQRRRELRRLVDELGIAVHLHNVFYDINLVSLVPEVRDLALHISEQVFELGQELSAQTITVHPGYMFGGWRRDEVQRERFWREAVTPLRRIGEIAERTGIKLLLENGSYFITTATGFRPRPLHLGIEPEELRRILEMSGRKAGVVLDINKAVHSGIAPIDFVKEIGERIEQLQISTVDRYREDIVAVIDALENVGRELGFVFEGSREEVEAAVAVFSGPAGP